MEQERGRLQSRLGFLLLSAGCAIGCGNVWKFPYLCGQGGGAAFLVIYLICLILLGIPIMTMEFSIGRAAQKSPVVMYKALGKSKFQFHGRLSHAANYGLLGFYDVVAAWIIRYFVLYATGKVSALSSLAEIETLYQVDTAANMPVMMIYVVALLLVSVFVCSGRIDKRLEKIEKVLLVGLLFIMVILAIRGITLEGGKKGLAFYLVPDFSKVTPGVVVSAMNQAFFTLSLGIGSMAIFGSYIGKEHSMTGESVRIIGMDTLAAFIAGLIIFPACFAFNIEPDAGPPLIFITLPNVFNSMVGGRIWGSLFFLFFSFAALSTVFAVFENLVAMNCDAHGWSRKKSCIIAAVILLVLNTVAVYGWAYLPDFNPFGMGESVMGIYDVFVNTFALPLGSLVYVIFCTNKFGWGWDNFLAEANAGSGMKMPKFLRPYCQFIIPIIIIVVFVIGLAGLQF